MNLVLDIGNTRTKAGIFVNDILKVSLVESDIHSIFEQLKNYSFSRIIVASVVKLSEEVLLKISQQGSYILFEANTPTPVQNYYKSANTLGSDRLAAVCGGYLLFKGQDFLVIDAGTCVKYNYTDKNGNFLGGGISPGLAMRYKALHLHTDKLPLISFDENYHDLVGNNTQNSIRMGVQLGLLAEVQGIINEFLNLYPQLNIVLTGGDAHYLQRGLKNNIFADKNLILKGLNSILNYQY